MILFAYAGNMDVDKLSKSVPSAKKIGIGKLPGYRFVFNTTSVEDESSKANVVQLFEPDTEVWGVLIHIADNERGNFFNPDPDTNDLMLETVNIVDVGGNVYHAEVFTTKPHAINAYLLPYDWYQQKILKLAKDAGLPESYITQIALMASKPDPDEQRAARRRKNAGL
jgi:hypothetical protein